MKFSFHSYAPNVPPLNFSHFNDRIISDDKHKSTIHNKFNYISSVVRKFVTREKISKLTSVCLTIRGNESFIKISDILQTNLKVFRLQSIMGMLWIETNFQVKGEIKHEKEAKSLCQFREGTSFSFISWGKTKMINYTEKILSWPRTTKTLLAFSVKYSY